MEQIAPAQRREASSTFYVPGQHAYWRLSAEGDDLVWETSGNGVSWVERHRERSPVDLDAVTVVLGAGSDATIIDGGSALFDDFRLNIPGCAASPGTP